MNDRFAPRVYWSHLNRDTYRHPFDLSYLSSDPWMAGGLHRILELEPDRHIFGIVGFADEPDNSPAIIVHNQPPHRILVRLRWLGAKVESEDGDWLYAPDICEMMLDRARVERLMTESDMMRFLVEWARVQDWGKEPETRW